jgi:hypothetical protein
VVAAWRGVAILLLGEGHMNSENEIKQGLLAVCKVKGWDGDFNILGFHVLCNKLKQLGVDEEREACAKVCEGINSAEYYYGERPELVCAAAIRARGNT